MNPATTIPKAPIQTTFLSVNIQNSLALRAYKYVDAIELPHYSNLISKKTMNKLLSIKKFKHIKDQRCFLSSESPYLDAQYFPLLTKMHQSLRSVSFIVPEKLLLKMKALDTLYMDQPAAFARNI